MTDEKYQPSNHPEVCAFIDYFCANCARFDDAHCDILLRSQAFDVADADYPAEWTYRDGKPVCTAFSEEPVPYRCDKTVDMFGEGM